MERDKNTGMKLNNPYNYRNLNERDNMRKNKKNVKQKLKDTNKFATV